MAPLITKKKRLLPGAKRRPAAAAKRPAPPPPPKHISECHKQVNAQIFKQHPDFINLDKEYDFVKDISGASGDVTMVISPRRSSSAGAQQQQQVLKFFMPKMDGRIGGGKTEKNMTNIFHEISTICAFSKYHSQKSSKNGGDNDSGGNYYFVKMHSFGEAIFPKSWANKLKYMQTTKSAQLAAMYNISGIFVIMDYLGGYIELNKITSMNPIFLEERLDIIRELLNANIQACIITDDDDFNDYDAHAKNIMIKKSSGVGGAVSSLASAILSSFSSSSRPLLPPSSVLLKLVDYRQTSYKHSVKHNSRSSSRTSTQERQQRRMSEVKDLKKNLHYMQRLSPKKLSEVLGSKIWSSYPLKNGIKPKKVLEIISKAIACKDDHMFVSLKLIMESLIASSSEGGPLSDPRIVARLHEAIYPVDNPKYVNGTNRRRLEIMRDAVNDIINDEY